MDRAKSIEVLNTLLEINNDRSQGYQTAMLETEEYGLKVWLSQFQQTSERCKQELIARVLKFGGIPLSGKTDLPSKIHRVWMDIKAVVTGNERVAILDSCLYGESITIDTYNTLIENNLEDLNAEDKAMLVAQCFSIKADQDQVKALRVMLIGE